MMSEFPSRRFDQVSDADLFERRDALQQALHDVVVPPGLQTRLIERLAREDVPDGVVEVGGGPKERKKSRRAMLGMTLVAGGGGLAACLGGLLWLRRPLDDQAVLAAAEGWLRDWSPDWSEHEGADIDGVPLPQALRRAGSYRWQRMATAFSRRTVAYELLPGAEALLFASKTQRALQLPAKPPANPRVRSGLWIYLVAWQETNCLYVVALKRNAQRQYERLLRVGTPASFT